MLVARTLVLFVVVRAWTRDTAGARLELAWWARSAFDYLAMGNYPYATGYILNDGDGLVTLPPWPLREACAHMADAEVGCLLKFTCCHTHAGMIVAS